MAGDTLQKFKSSLNRGVTAISLKTSSSLEKVKIKTHIDSLNAEIKRLHSAIGETAYAIWESGSEDYSKLQESFAAIQQKKAEIAQLEAEYNTIDERDSQILGTTTEAAPETQGVVCPNCGINYTAQVRFCRKCGCKLTND